MTVKRPLVKNQPQIGKFIREIRLEVGLTQEQFASQLGATYSTVNRACERAFQAFAVGAQVD